MRSDRLRLDMLSVVYQQRYFLRSSVVRYLRIDSSPQLGFNSMCTIEDVFVIPSSSTFSLLTSIKQLNLQNDFDSSHELMSSTGSGRAGLVNEPTNVCNLLLMRSGNDERFHELRGQYRGLLSDQGTEKDVSDICLDMLPRYRNAIDPQSKTSYVFPSLLGLPGLLHILYDALELCCKRNPLYKVWIGQLKTLTSFVTDASLVQYVKATCFEGAKDEANRFQRQATTHID